MREKLQPAERRTVIVETANYAVTRDPYEIDSPYTLWFRNLKGEWKVNSRHETESRAIVEASRMGVAL